MSRLGQIKLAFKSALKEIKASLHRQRWREALIFLSFVLLSLGFWLLQSLQQEYEITLNIPVRYKNIPPDIAFTATKPETISFKVKDKGSVLLNYTFGRSFAPVEVNMKTQTNNGKLLVKKKEIESNIQKQLISTTALVSIDPQQIDIPYSKRIKKDIPVIFNGVVQTEPGFKVSGDIRISPSDIHVYATETVLDTIGKIKTVFTDIKKGNKTITRNVQLLPIEGATFDPETVSITFPIEEFTEKTLEIPVICTDLPSRYTIRTFPSVIKVTCSIPLSRFKDVKDDEFTIYISFSDLEQNVTGTLPIQLAKKPDWIDNVSLSPDKIEFILEQNK